MKSLMRISQFIGSISLFLAMSASAQTPFLSYWFSWSQGNNSYMYTNLTDIPAGVTDVLIAFAIEDNEHKLTFQAWDMSAIKTDIDSLRGRGVRVILSTGGAAAAAYPWEDTTLTDQQVADQFIDFIKTYGFDGIDFDVESQGAGSRIPNIVQLIKSSYPNITISLTVPSTGSAGPGSDDITPQMITLAKALYAINGLNYINLMNYDQNWQPSNCKYDVFDASNPTTNCYIQNLNGAVTSLTKVTGDPTTAKKMIVQGIMIGKADDNKIVTPQLAAQLSQYAKTQGYGGVMTWGLSRDHNGTDLASSTGMSEYSPGEYTQTIINALR